MTLRAHIVIDARKLDVEINVADGEKVAILGPNGAGKSSALEAIAGLLRPDRGFATLDGETLYDIGRGNGTSWHPPHSRGTALLAQDPLLFPHLTVVDNVGFGPRSRGSSRSESRAVANTWLEQVDAVEFSERKPAQLSGGQAQRIAVARALAADPKLLLLDEPMAALDVAVVPALRQMLRRVLADRSAIIITHDVLDALLLADRVIVIEDGRVVEDGPTAAVLKHPRSQFAARIAGLNMVMGTAHDGTIQADNGTTIEGLSADSPAEGTRAVGVFSPGAVSVHRTAPGGSPRNVIAARVTEIEPLGDRMRVRTDEFDADITPASVAALDLVPGSEVLLVVKANEVSIYAV